MWLKKNMLKAITIGKARNEENKNAVFIFSLRKLKGVIVYDQTKNSFSGFV